MARCGRRRTRAGALATLCAPFLLATGAAATPESEASVLFLLISPSSRVNGMGQGGVALTDEPGGYYNPAAPALVARRYTVAAVVDREPVAWLPTLASDLEYAYRTVQVGWRQDAPRRTGSGARDTPSFSAALSWYRSKLTLGRVVRTDERGQVAGAFEARDRASAYVVSLAAHHFVDVGIGLSLKRVDSRLADFSGGVADRKRAQITARDVGLLLRLPVLELAGRATGQALPVEGVVPRLDLSTGVSWNNRGDRVDYGDGQPDPLPANRAAGWALSAGVGWQGPGWSLDVLRATWVWETYTPQVDGADNDGASDDRRGVELSLAETFDYRFGQLDDDDGDRHVDTRGWTLRSDGLFRLLLPRLGGADGSWKRWVRHLSVSWTRLDEDSGDGPAARGDDLVQIGLRL